MPRIDAAALLFPLVFAVTGCGANAEEPGSSRAGDSGGASSAGTTSVSSGGASSSIGAGGSVASGGSFSSSGGTFSGAGSGGDVSSAAGGSTTSSSGGTSSAAQGTCVVLYNGETGAGDVNLGGGTVWTDPNGENGTSSVTEVTTNPHGATTSMKIDLQWNEGYYGGAFGFNWANYSAAGAYDLTSATNLEFWVRVEAGENDHFVVWLGDSSGTASTRDQAGGYVPLVTTDWQHFSIPLTAYSGVDFSKIWELDGDTHSKPFGAAGGVVFYMDDIAFTGPSCQ